MKYRPEIDGLRALAVVPVILYHAGFEAFGGGFVGVDIFFVISGYLITTIVAQEVEAGRFSFTNFYKRRARRILPALFVVALASVPLALTYLPSKMLAEFFRSLTSISLSASNFLFWSESGYFDTNAAHKPMLHTWSLSVEEQFYVLLPILLITSLKFGRRATVKTLAAITIASLLLAEVGWRQFPVANYYLLPTRAWELTLGALSALTLMSRGRQVGRDWLSLAGIALICFAVFTFDEGTPFPSLYTLIPVSGAALVIIFTHSGGPVARILGGRVPVAVGLVSYSAYLWHQPLFAFAWAVEFAQPAPRIMLYLSLASFLIGYLSWRLVERPFRNPESFVGRHILPISFVGLLTLGVGGLYGVRVAPHSEPHAGDVSYSFEDLNHGDLPVYIVGDSHGGHLVAGLAELNSYFPVNMTFNGCMPFRNVDRYNTQFVSGTCLQVMNEYLDELRDVTEKSVVILASMGPIHLDGTTFKGKDPGRLVGLNVEWAPDRTLRDRYEIFELGMRETLAELLENPNLHIIFAIDIPELGIEFGCQESSNNSKLFGTSELEFDPSRDCVVTRADYDLRASKYKDLVFKVLQDFPEVHAFDPTPHFCNLERCLGYLEPFGYLYMDVDHLSRAGSVYYADKLIGSAWFP